jgi:excisionase family DNA binding protein
MAVLALQGEANLTTGQAARLLGVSPEWVRRLVARGRLDAIQTPYGLLFDPASVARERERRQQAAEGATTRVPECPLVTA